MKTQTTQSLENKDLPDLIEHQPWGGSWSTRAQTHRGEPTLLYQMMRARAPFRIYRGGSSLGEWCRCMKSEKMAMGWCWWWRRDGYGLKNSWILRTLDEGGCCHSMDLWTIRARTCINKWESCSWNLAFLKDKSLSSTIEIERSSTWIEEGWMKVEGLWGPTRVVEKGGLVPSLESF